MKAAFAVLYDDNGYARGQFTFSQDAHDLLREDHDLGTTDIKVCTIDVELPIESEEQIQAIAREKRKELALQSIKEKEEELARMKEAFQKSFEAA